MSKKRVKRVTSSTVIPQLVLNRRANSQKTSETGFSVQTFLGTIEFAKECGPNKPVYICNAAGAVGWVNFGTGDGVELSSVADGVTEPYSISTVVDGVTADVDGVTGTISSATATWVTDGVNPGDIAVVSGGADAGSFEVVSVDAEGQLTVLTPVSFVGDVAQTVEVLSVTLGTITSATATWVTDGVTVSDTAIVGSPSPDSGFFPITAVVGETELTVDVSSLLGGFSGDSPVDVTVTTLVPVPTGFDSGILVPPNSTIVLASGNNFYVRGSAATLAANVAHEDILEDADDQPEV